MAGKEKSTAKGQATLRGRFPAGTVVGLVRAAGAHTLRSEGGEEVDRKKVSADGEVKFTGLDIDGRYFAVGLVDGHPLEVRLRGRVADDDAGLLAQPPVGPDRVRLGLAGAGGFADELDAPIGSRPTAADEQPQPTERVVADDADRPRLGVGGSAGFLDEHELPISYRPSAGDVG